MQIKVEAVTKEPRSYNGQVNWGVKLPGDGGWITFYREQPPKRGDTLDVNITERRGKDGKIYKDAFPVMPPLVELAKQPGQDNGTQPQPKVQQITWDDYREAAKAIHSLALEFEPDIPTTADEPGTYIDRAPARVGFINKALEHYVYGKFIVPKDDDGYVAPDDGDDTIPF